MKKLLTAIITLCSFSATAQQITADDWNEQAKTNIRLLPKYGNAVKTEAQKSADKEFIKTTLVQYPIKRMASDHLIELGFKYLTTDTKTAMYRFNQAYLLDSANSDIYWGYGAVYMTLGDLVNAQIQYQTGLSKDPKSTHLLTDYGTYLMTQYYGLQSFDEKDAMVQLDSAITYLAYSYGIDSKDLNTTFKLSVCYYQKADCKNAWRYYNECRQLGGQPITDEFTKALEQICKRP